MIPVQTPPVMSDSGYWYVCKAVQDADGAWSAPAIGGAGWCAMYADIGGVKYCAIRLPTARTDLPTIDSVALIQIFSANSYTGEYFCRVGGS